MLSSMSRSVVVVVAWWLASPAAAKRWRAPEREPGLPLALVVGLPKMVCPGVSAPWRLAHTARAQGTTSLRNYFHCSGYRASHMACSNGPHCGACVSEFAAAVGKLGAGPRNGDSTSLQRECSARA